jgi:hypothetical protein
MTKPNGPAPQPSKTDADSCRRLLERVAASRKFQKSARMRELLLYLGGRSLDQPGCEIHEQEIGVAVFGRPLHYDTVADTIGRVNVYDLRKKLDSHFSTDGRHEPVIVSIPKGSYCPEFVAREASPELPSEPASSAGPATRFSRYLLPALCGVLLVACIGLTIRVAQLSAAYKPRQLPPALRGLWSGLLAEGRTTDVVLADSNLSLLQDFVQQPLQSTEYRSGNLARQAEAILGSSSHRIIDTLMARRYTSIADVHLVSQIFLLDGLDARQFRVHFARDFAPEDLRTSNVILSGSKRSNPWVQLFEDDLNFRFDHDEATGYAVIVNKHPRPGEQERYVTSVRSPTLESYGVVAFVPNLGNTGNVLIIAGGGMNATGAAADFVTHNELLDPFLRRAGWQTGQALPYFEVLLETTVMGATLLPPRVVCFRLGNPRPSAH